jgi:hypothetical protein
MSLDTMTRSELVQFAGQCHNAALIKYAQNKVRAMDYRAVGDGASAWTHEEICDRIYANLPQSARW